MTPYVHSSYHESIVNGRMRYSRVSLARVLQVLHNPEDNEEKEEEEVLVQDRQARLAGDGGDNEPTLHCRG